MRRVLMVAYHFPPVGGVGVERTLKHATYLPEHGWEAVVVAPSNSAYRIVDPSSVARIPPGVDMWRAPTVEPAHLRRLVGRLVPRPASAANPSSPAEPTRSPRSSGRGGIRAAVNGAWAFVVPRLFFPDDQLLWIPGAIVAGELAQRRSPIDAVYSSSPPVSGHLAAAVIAHRLGVPWIADFRDPWIGNAFASRMPAIHRAMQRELELAIVARADRVIFASDRWRQRYAERYPDHAPRFVHSPNGYDRADLGARVPRGTDDDGPVRLIYAGSIYGDTELALFLDGLTMALARDPSLHQRLRVDFVGLLNPHNRAIANARRADLDPVVTFVDHRPRPEVLAMERSADAGLILIADQPGRDADVNAKLYEYLGLDLPVLAVAPPGETRSTLEALDWGIAANPDASGVADGLAALMTMERPTRAADPDGRYDRRRLAVQLAGLLDEITG